MTSKAFANATDANRQQGGRRNLIINGDFQISQRGDYTSATSLTNGAYTLDRWTCTNGVSATIQHRSDMPTGEYGKSVKVLTSSGGTFQCALEQRIEVADWMKGKSVTATVWMRSNSSNSSINFYNNIDGFDTPVSHSGNEQWEKLTIQTTFPTGSLTDLRLRIGLSQGGNTTIVSGDYFEIAQVQLEVGDTATPFEHRSYGEELALCQRYYQVSNGNLYHGPSTTGFFSNSLNWATEMRASPSASQSGGTSGNIIQNTVDNITKRGARFTIQSNAGNAFATEVNVSLDAEL